MNSTYGMSDFMHKIVKATAIPVRMLFGISPTHDVADDIKYLLEKFEDKNPSIKEIQKALRNKINDRRESATAYIDRISSIYGVCRKKYETNDQLRERLLKSLGNHK